MCTYSFQLYLLVSRVQDLDLKESGSKESRRKDQGIDPTSSRNLDRPYSCRVGRGIHGSIGTRATRQSRDCTHVWGTLFGFLLTARVDNRRYRSLVAVVAISSS